MNQMHEGASRRVNKVNILRKKGVRERMTGPGPHVRGPGDSESEYDPICNKSFLKSDGSFDGSVEG